MPDAPMQGEMDPFFFLTKHKNFIPHEYPCRTDLRRALPRQAAGRARRLRAACAGGCPSARRGSTSPASGSARPGSPPGRAPASRRTAAGTARVRLGTCGGAVIWVNGAEAGWMAPYSRNLEEKREFELPLERGPERDRDLLRRPRRARRALLLPARLSRRARGARSPCRCRSTAPSPSALEAALDGMHFDRTAYLDGDITLVFGRPLPADVKVNVAIEGDFMSTRALRLRLRAAGGRDAAGRRPRRAGARRLPPFPRDARRRRLRRLAARSASRSAMSAGRAPRRRRSPRASTRRSTRSRSTPSATRCAPSRGSPAAGPAPTPTR